MHEICATKTWTEINKCRRCRSVHVSSRVHVSHSSLQSIEHLFLLRVRGHVSNTNWISRLISLFVDKRVQRLICVNVAVSCTHHDLLLSGVCGWVDSSARAVCCSGALSCKCNIETPLLYALLLRLGWQGKERVSRAGEKKVGLGAGVGIDTEDKEGRLTMEINYTMIRSSVN